MSDSIRLHGFNNLTKSLSFNIYDVTYCKTPRQQEEYLDYIDEVFNADKITRVLKEVANIVDAHILNIAMQDYEPQGASAAILISEEPVENFKMQAEEPGPVPSSVLAHLDKSHLTVHTYPESHPDNGISTFRVDIEVSTCGKISPLKALNYLLHEFESDVVTIDYRVRGFTRSEDGDKHFIDHEITSIQNFMDDEIGNMYDMVDMNFYDQRLFHTKMRAVDFDINEYLFGHDSSHYSESELQDLEKRLKHEITEIFYSRRFPKNWV